MKAHVLSLLLFAACGDDAVTPSIALVHTTEVRASFELDTGHAPFATDPGGLAAAIEQAIER
jgi:hypothetical protein